MSVLNQSGCDFDHPALSEIRVLPERTVGGSVPVMRDEAECEELSWGDEKKDAFEDLKDVEGLVAGAWYEREGVMPVHCSSCEVRYEGRRQLEIR